jgi:hypothetical protein
VRRGKSIWELAAFFIFGAILLQIAVAEIRPLIPYILAVIGIVALVWIGNAIYQRTRNW